jgi:uncharacterized protein
MFEFPWKEGQLHLFQIGGRFILFDVASSSLFSLDQVAYHFLEEGGKRSLEDALAQTCRKFGQQAEEALRELELLYSQGQILGPDPALGVNYVPFPYLKALCLNLAHECNMRCSYCFAGQGAYGGERGLMPLEVAKKAVDFLLERSGPLKRLEIDFFGGEPLMDFPVLKETVFYGKERGKEVGKEIRFTVTTNCLLLSEPIMEFLNQMNMRVVLSIDGRKEDHDKNRRLLSGQGTHDLVLSRIKRFLSLRGETLYYLRGTYTAQTLDFLANALYLFDLGYCEVSMEPVVATPEEPYAIREEHLPSISRQYELLAREIDRREREGKELHFFHFEVDTTGLTCVSKRLAGCGAGVEYLAVTPSGALYPCHQFVGRPGFKMGTVWEGITSREKLEEFQHLSFLEKEGCRTCWARYLCSGGCHANHHLLNGDLRKPDSLGCQITRKRMECALYLKFLRRERAGEKIFY